MRKLQFEGKNNVSGDRIRELRLRARLSQATLAAKMQTEGALIEQDAISRIESGSRLVTDYELLVLTRIFSVSADWLIGGRQASAAGLILRRFSVFYKALPQIEKGAGFNGREKEIQAPALGGSPQNGRGA